MKTFITLLFFLIINVYSHNIITIDLVLNTDSFYRIKNIDSNLQISFDNNNNINLMPYKYIKLIKMIMTNNKILYNCFTKKVLLDKEYQTFGCERNIKYKDLDKIKLNFNFENYNISMNISELFSKQGNFYYFNFYSYENNTYVFISDHLLKESLIYNNNNVFLRKLEGEENDNDNTKKDNDTNVEGENNKQNKNINNSGIGWLGICFIILLSVIVIYVLYVGFRYYRRKKYQNPSFYYKITEEMFDDITPIE